MKRTKDNMKAMKSKYLRLAAVGFAASLALTACQEHIHSWVIRLQPISRERKIVATL